MTGKKWQEPTIAALLDAAGLLGSEMVWDPAEYPNGPGEAERPVLLAALGVVVERLRGHEQNPAVIGVMSTMHAQALDHDPTMIAEQAATVLTYHAEILDHIHVVDGCCNDAAALARTAASILTSGLMMKPYQRMRLVSITGGRCQCGEEH